MRWKHSVHWHRNSNNHFQKHGELCQRTSTPQIFLIECRYSSSIMSLPLVLYQAQRTSWSTLNFRKVNGELETQIANAVHFKGLASSEKHMFQSRAKLLKLRMASNSGWNYLLVNERFSTLFSARYACFLHCILTHTIVYSVWNYSTMLSYWLLYFKFRAIQHCF